MTIVVVKTQAEWNALPEKYAEYTTIEIRADSSTWITVNKTPAGSRIEAWGSSHVVAWGSSHVEAWGSSHVEARESSHVEAWGSSHVVAWGSSHVEAWGSSHVVARESSHVVAWESSHVEAWGSSHVVAWGSSHVVAWGSSAVHAHGDLVEAVLFGFAVCIALAKGKITKKSKTATLVRPKRAKGTAGWIEREGADVAGGQVKVFKRVSKDFKTQENTKNETLWQPGTTVEHPAWSPKDKEVGPGKFHACARTYFCDEYRSGTDDRYVAIAVDKKDLFAWDDNPEHPHKIAFRAGVVLHECDRYGKQVPDEDLEPAKAAA